MKLVIVRHYKTKSNTQELIMGWSDAEPEDDFADDLYFVESRLLISNYNFEAVWTSKLERARKTAKFFAKLNKIQTDLSTNELNELNYGVVTNKRKKWVEKHYPKHKNDPDFVYPEGESFRQMKTRCVDFIDQQYDENKDKTVLLVVHAGVIRGLVCHYLQLPYSENLKRRVGHRYIGVLDINKKGTNTYKEMGEESDFILDEVVSVPH